MSKRKRVSQKQSNVTTPSIHSNSFAKHDMEANVNHLKEFSTPSQVSLNLDKNTLNRSGRKVTFYVKPGSSLEQVKLNSSPAELEQSSGKPGKQEGADMAEKNNEASKPASEPVPAPGTNTKAEMEFLQDGADQGAKIYQDIAEMSPEILDQAEKKADEAAIERNEPKTGEPSPEIKPEFEFLESTAEDGARIYQDIAEMSPEILKEAEDKADKIANEVPQAKEEKPKPIKVTKTEGAYSNIADKDKIIAQPGTNQADEFKFLEETGDEGAAIYQDIAQMSPEILDEAQEKADKAANERAKEEKKAQKAEVKEEKKTAKAQEKESKKEAKAQEKAVKKEPEAQKEPAPAFSVDEEALSSYRNFSNETLLEMLNELGYQKDFDELAREIAAAQSLDDYTVDLVLEGFRPENTFTFEEDGFDLGLIPVLVSRIAQSLPYKASDMADLSVEIAQSLNENLGEDGMKNADLYHKLFDQVRTILIRGQKLGVDEIEALDHSEDHEFKKLITHFMNVAYDLLPYWQYEDVRYYEGFIFAVLSQFKDLEDLQNRAMMDVADLYIKHGDYGRGDADYNYLIRENNLKDQIYYRFANVYRNMDRNKAKQIAGESLRFVDDRYDYYPKLIEILES